MRNLISLVVPHGAGDDLRCCFGLGVRRDINQAWLGRNLGKSEAQQEIDNFPNSWVWKQQGNPAEPIRKVIVVQPPAFMSH